MHNLKEKKALHDALTMKQGLGQIQEQLMERAVALGVQVLKTLTILYY